MNLSRASAVMYRKACFSLLSIAVIFTICSAMPACSANKKPDRESDTVNAEGDTISTADSQLDAIIEAAIDSMTIEEKIGQLFMPAVYASDDIHTLLLIRRYAEEMHIGGLILLKGTKEEAMTVAREYKDYCSILPFISIDAEWGLGMRLTDATSYPTNSRLGPSANAQTMYDYGVHIARQCDSLGINMVLGPVLDVAEKGSFMSSRSFGNDAKRVAELGVAYSRGIYDGNIICVAKHFPGHGSVNADTHKHTGSIIRSLHDMQLKDLYPFQCFIDSGLPAVMVGHLNVPAVDYDERPAAVSYSVMTDLLRNDMGFKGLILTDALNMGAAKGYDAVDALKGGADIILAPLDTQKEIKAVMDALNSGELGIELINEKLERILRAKFRLQSNF